ncbi:MAG: LysE family transporter, partial [Acidobacteria bacterium]|nr:LysE family transporter [Acidobacteriota bacterium]
LGFSIAAPVGPIGLLCIRRTLAEGKASGFVSGLSAATADAFYGFVAAFGLTAISAFLLHYLLPLRLIGGLFLFYLAVKIFFSKATEKAANAKIDVPLWKSYSSTVFLTLTNPTTILSFMAVFAGLGIVGSDQNYLTAGSMVLGVFLGSALWWLILSSGVGWFKNKFDARRLIWVNRISGVLIATLGLWSVLGAKS